MVRLWWRIAARFYAIRHRRALVAAALSKSRSEKFFTMLKGPTDDFRL